MGAREIIGLSGVGCKAGYRYLLHDVNWSVGAGEHWVVFGMNGSGKTTLLSIVAGFRHFTEGEVRLFGEPLSNDNVLGMRRRMGWISSSFFDNHYTRESALDIVLSGLTGTLGVNRAPQLDEVARAKDLLAELGLGDKFDRGFDMLSKGERQNVLIARALVSDPDVLIMDEPCTGLDVYNRSYLFSTIDSLSERKDLTIVYVTHYVEEITPLFDRCLLLRAGHVFAKGATRDLVTSESFTELLGYPVAIETPEEGRFRLDVATESHIARFLGDKGGDAR